MAHRKPETRSHESKTTPPNWENRTLFHKDNLEVLRGMNSESVDLIATDPPFNKGKDFHATPDSLAAGARFQDRWSWREDVHEEWIDQITDDHPRVMYVIESSRRSYGDDMGAFLCFMAVRLLEMRRVLKSIGSIYLHCDPTASHYLKQLMDAIFGVQNFRNEIIWHYAKGNPPRKDFRRKHDVLIRYTKSKAWVFNQPRMPHLESQRYRFNLRDDDGREYRINHTRDSEGQYKRFYWDDGVAADDVWTYLRERSFDQLAHNDRQRTGYPTQKPLALYERIIKASSNEGDIVLDPFAGCATTLVAAERLSRQWVGIDIWDAAHRTMMDRLQKEGLTSPDGDSRGALPFGAIHYTKEPPERTDDAEQAAPNLRTINRRKRPLEPWQKLTNAQIRKELEDAQSVHVDLVLCAGCGRELEAPFMELDHITPKSDRGVNDISNRILLCRLCNGKKSNSLTMVGLFRENKRSRWMKDEARAKLAKALAKKRYEKLSDEA